MTEYELSQEIKGYDPTYKYVFSASWSDYEDYAWIYIFEKDGKYYSLEGGQCSGAGYGYFSTEWDHDWQFLEYLTDSQDEVLQVMMDWQDCED